MKYYLDTCIWRDLHENRVDRFRPLGEWALRLINNIIENKDKVLYSELTVIELKIKFNENKENRASIPINNFILTLPNPIITPIKEVRITVKKEEIIRIFKMIPAEEYSEG